MIRFSNNSTWRTFRSVENVKHKAAPLVSSRVECIGVISTVAYEAFMGNM